MRGFAFVEIFINFSSCALTQKSFYDFPFPLCLLISHFRATFNQNLHIEIHRRPTTIQNPHFIGLRILIFDKGTGNLSPVVATALVGPQPTGAAAAAAATEEAAAREEAEAESETEAAQSLGLSTGIA